MKPSVPEPVAFACLVPPLVSLLHLYTHLSGPKGSCLLLTAVIILSHSALSPPPQCDIISCGAQVNPSVSVAMFVYGAISFYGAIVRIIAQFLAGAAAYPLL
jgi:hypothetical protein